MALLITDEQLKASGLTEQQVRLELAVRLFELNVFTLGKAAEFAGIHKLQMQQELAARKIPMHYDLEMLNEDIQNIREV
ncbi:MAG: UPF0175 family protein [Chitinophagales bacterium]